MKAREKRRRRQLRKARRRLRWRKLFESMCEGPGGIFERLEAVGIYPEWLHARPMTDEEAEAGRSL